MRKYVYGVIAFSEAEIDLKTNKREMTETEKMEIWKYKSIINLCK